MPQYRVNMMTLIEADDKDEAAQLVREELGYNGVVTSVEEDPYAEPPGAGKDPYGRPDPQTHPEYWCE